MNNNKYQLPSSLKHKCAVWEITLKCNSNCIHCGSLAGRSRLHELETEEALKLVKELKSCGYDGIALMGGEPFLRSDWYDIAREIKKNDMKLTIVSNGLEIINHIQQLEELEIECISLSLDGGNPKTHDYIRGIEGSFNKVLESIRLIKSRNLPLSVITTVNKLNFKELYLIRDFLLNKRIAWQIQISLPIGRFPRGLTISRKEYYAIALFIALNLRKYSPIELPLIGAHCFGYFSITLPELGLDPWFGCQAGRSVLGIQSNGNIKGCLILPNNYIMGNIRTKSLNEILKTKFNLINAKNSETYCHTCDSFKKCKGGCLGTVIALNSYHKPYCLRAIENELFNYKKFPFRWKINSKISKYKYLYNKMKI